MQKAIDKLKELAESHQSLADKLENGELAGYEEDSETRRETLIRTWRYWSQCLFIAAWLLENEVKTEND